MDANTPPDDTFATDTVDDHHPNDDYDTPNDDYDNPWKRALDHALPEFLQMYFPQAHGAIDWSEPVESLDTELPSIVRDAELGKRHADKLVRVTLRSGEQDIVYIHVEVQTSPEAAFSERLFVYHYRLFDRYRQRVATLAVLADLSPGWRPGPYTTDTFGCRLTAEFPCVKLADYAPRLDALLEDDNPFGLLTAAHLLTQRTRGKPDARYHAKLKLIRLLIRKGWNRQSIIDWFAIIDWMMHLPKTMTQQLRLQLTQDPEWTTMRYVTSFERLEREEAFNDGKAEGEVNGSVKGRRAVVERQLILKFGPLTDTTTSLLSGATESQLDLWAERILFAHRIEDVFGEA